MRAPRPATREELARVHTADVPRRSSPRPPAARRCSIADTFTSPESHEIALLAAGAAIEAARHAWRTGEPAFALVRPPGHHAEPDRAMGFCLYNNIAIAAAALRADGVERVAIVDIDVHHGNGTQAAFYADPAVLFVSSHQYPYYPGTGAADETGAGAGVGFTLNLPMAAGATRRRLRVGVYETAVVPALERFAPDVMLVSAGLRRARARSARRHAHDDGGLPRGSCSCSTTPRSGSAAAASRSSPRAATTSTPCASA